MEGFSFGKINTSSKKNVSHTQVVDNIVLADIFHPVSSKNNKPVNILLDEYYCPEDIRTLCEFFNDNGIYRYKIIMSLNVKITREEIEKTQKDGIINFYIANSSNFEKELIPQAPIVTVGAALYALIKENDLIPKDFQQTRFCPSYFWFSKDLTKENCHRVFPIESFYDLYDTVDSKIQAEEVKIKSTGLFSDKPQKKEVSTRVAKKVFARLPRDSFRTKLAVEQIKLLKELGYKPLPDYKGIKKIYIESEEDFDKLFYEPNKDRKDDMMSWDIETSGLDFLKDTIGCVTVSFDGQTGYYLPWKYVNKRKFNYLLSNNKQLGANLKYDIKYFWREGLPNAKIDEDVIVLGHCLDETRSMKLKSLSFYFTEYGGYERPLDIYKKKTGVENYLKIPENILRDYATMDAIVAWRVWKNAMDFTKKLDELYSSDQDNGILDYYHDRCIPAANMYAKLEFRGFYVNKDKLDALRIRMTQFIKDTKEELSKRFKDYGINPSFNWNSDSQLGTLLEKAGWEDLGRISTGQYQVSDFQLKRWDKTHHEEVKLIQDLKHVSTLLNGFVGDDQQVTNSLNLSSVDDPDAGTKGWPQYMVYHPEDNSWRMHANYFSMGTDSGRTRCKNPNLQNTPTRGLFASDIKKCVCTPNDDEYYLVTIDYSSLQMRLAAIDTDAVGQGTRSRSSDGKYYPIDENLYKAFWTPNIDMHSKTAYLSFCSAKKFDVETIEVEQDGKTYKFLGGEMVITKNRGEILARNLKEDDELEVG